MKIMRIVFRPLGMYEIWNKIEKPFENVKVVVYGAWLELNYIQMANI